MIHLILVEDDQDDQEFLIEALQSIEKVDVTIALDGVELLTLLKQNRFRQANLIVMDLLLPRKDGYETLLEIRKDPALDDIPIMILTTSVLDEERCLKAGCAKYFLKPSSVNDYKVLAGEILKSF